ncbi:hypothetical protein K438DRAFT_2137811 [Mycena galopus ATCC 62051]|nr:hypothetical protein K438DRAFT_2137811 [Mycena galopus ATCC 62051]
MPLFSTTVCLLTLTKTSTINEARAGIDLILHIAFWYQYPNSHFTAVFFWACLDASQHIALACGRPPHWSQYTPWIQLSTGSLTIELALPEALHTTSIIREIASPPSITSLLNPPPTFEIISLISLVDYHCLCHWHLGQLGQLTAPTNMPIQLGSIRHISGAEYESSLEIAFSANLKLIDRGWITSDEGTSILENGWIRVNSACIAEEYCRWVEPYDVFSEGWLVQACHIFNSLDIKSNLKDYVFVKSIQSGLKLWGPIENLPPSYLFLCPFAELETDLSGCFAIPGCTAYWSTDPSGAEQLSAAEAKTLGLPEIHSWTEVWRICWDSSDYAGICHFHEAKGFDPYSQDVAIELGYPLFQVSCQWDNLFTQWDNLFTQSCEINRDEDYSESEGGSVGEGHESISPNAEDALDAEISSTTAK